MKTSTLLICTAVAITVAVLYLDRRATRAELAALRPAKAERAAKQKPVVWPSPLLGRGSDEALTARPAAPSAEPSSPATADATQHKPAETPIDQFAPIHDALEAAFASEARDGAWAMEARRTVDATLSAELPAKSAIKSIDCRSTLCRIESTHDGYTYAKAFVNQLVLPERRPWNGAFYTGPVARDPQSGAVTFVTYLAREGAAMPTIPDHASEEQAVR